MRRLRLRAQRLYGADAAAAKSTADVVKQMCALQAQVATAVPLAVRARSSGLTVADVESARLEERSVVRTWCMRGTLQLLATEDLGWLIPLVGPAMVRASRRRREQLGLDAATEQRARRILIRYLENAPASRDEIAERFAERDVPVGGQTVYHVVRHAALEGVVCCGPERNGEQTYVLLRDWVPADRLVDAETARCELMSRYLHAHGPATPADLASWSGLPIRETRTAWTALASRMTEVRVHGQSAWMFSTGDAQLKLDSSEPARLRLVPEFDPYLLGYATREVAVPARAAKLVHAGGGVMRAAVLDDGRAVGIWRRRPHRRQVRVEFELIEPLSARGEQELAGELADLARFLNVEVTPARWPSR